MSKIRGIVEPELRFTIEEAAGEVDGKHIIGKIRGEFFVPDGVSRNKRYYPAALWHKVCSDPKIAKRLQERRMLGTISHEQEIDDKALLEGKVSHIVTNLTINDKNKGIGEALILNTPAGQVLNTLARAGVKLYVSSRANGSYANETFDGMPVVNKDDYELETFDIVGDPGFIEANPELIESFSNEQKELLNIGGPEMDESTKKLMERLEKENNTLQSDVKTALDTLEENKNKVTVLTSEVESLKEEKTQMAEKLVTLEKYEAIGSAEKIEKALDKLEEAVEFFKKHGTMESITTKLETTDELEKEKSETEAELGDKEKVKEALIKARDLLLEYKSFGTVSEIESVFEIVEKRKGQIKEEVETKRAQDLADELGVAPRLIMSFGMDKSDSEIRDFFATFKESMENQEKYGSGKTSKKVNKNENKNSGWRPEGMKGSSTKRLMESF